MLYWPGLIYVVREVKQWKQGFVYVEANKTTSLRYRCCSIIGAHCVLSSRSKKDIQDDKFEGKVRIRGIKLITQEQLQNIGQIVESKAKASEGK